MIPDWMKAVGNGDCPPDQTHVRRRRNYIQKGIIGFSDFIVNSMDADLYSGRGGLMQSIDPRVKLISVVAFIFSVSVVHDIRLLLVVYSLTLVCALLSRIDPLFFLKRVWLFVPIFAGVIVLPAIFNVFVPGDSLVTLAYLGPDCHIGPFALPEVIFITREGIMLALVFTVRVATCVSAGVLLFLTTRRDALFKSLRTLGVPSIYVLTLDMSYRYIFLLIDMVRDFYVARKSRAIRDRPLREEQGWVGGRIGYTLVKTLSVGEDVHKAMVSRGFDGDAETMHDFKIRGRDYAAGGFTLVFCVLLVAVSQGLVAI